MTERLEQNFILICSSFDSNTKMNQGHPVTVTSFKTTTPQVFDPIFMKTL